MQMKRYRIVLLTSILFLASCLLSCQERVSPWKQAEKILQRITPPVFAEKKFLLTEYGAKGDGSTDCTEAFRKAIEKCSKNGGGRVVVPRGTYLTGPIHLLSNTNLFLEDSAVILFDRNPRAYLPLVLTRWEGVECMNYSPLIYAYDQQNVAVTGKGILDGQANDTSWWPWKGNAESGWREGMPNQNAARQRLFKMGETGVPVGDRTFGEGWYLRPSFLQLYKCRNVLIEGVKIIHSPMWEIHPVLSENITIRNVDIDTHGPNNDGIDPECSRDILIEGCSFNTGDDCIAIKSGRNNDGRRVTVPSENIIIRHCRFVDGHGGVTIGSEISGSARNIFAEDCAFDSPVLYSALRLKSNAVRGGTIENLYLRRLTVGQVERAAFDVDLQYEEGENGNFLPTIRNIEIDSMVVGTCGKAMNLVGYERAPLRRIRISNSEFREARKESSVKYIEDFEMDNCTVNGKPFTGK